MTDEDFLKALAPEINPDRALLEALARYREAVAHKIAPGEEPVQIIGFDPAVGRDKSVVMMNGGLRIGKTTLLEKMGYLSENGEGK